MSRAFNIAVTWFDGPWNEGQAKDQAERWGVEWDDVLLEYGMMYAEMEGYSRG